MLFPFHLFKYTLEIQRIDTKNGHIWVAVSPPFGKRPIILSMLVFREGTHSKNIPFCWMGKTEWVYTLQLAICPVILWEKMHPPTTCPWKACGCHLYPLIHPHYESESKVQGPTNTLPKFNVNAGAQNLLNKHNTLDTVQLLGKFWNCH